MITTENVTVKFGSEPLFENVNIKFSSGNCYGLIGANGAGKSTFLKVLSGELEPTSGEVHIKKGMRISVLKQNQKLVLHGLLSLLRSDHLVCGVFHRHRHAPPHIL